MNFHALHRLYQYYHYLYQHYIIIITVIIAYFFVTRLLKIIYRLTLTFVDKSFDNIAFCLNCILILFDYSFQSFYEPLIL